MIVGNNVTVRIVEIVIVHLVVQVVRLQTQPTADQLAVALRIERHDHCPQVFAWAIAHECRARTFETELTVGGIAPVDDAGVALRAAATHGCLDAVAAGLVKADASLLRIRCAATADRRCEQRSTTIC